MPRSTFTGSLTIGFVNVPVQAYKATESHDIGFKRLCPCGSKVSLKNVCMAEGREVQYSEFVKGYEVTEDQILRIEKSEIESIQLKTNYAIDIKFFVQASQFDEVHIAEKTYYVAPAPKQPDKSFQVIRDVMKKAGFVAIAQVVVRDREHIVALRPRMKGFLMQELYFVDEVRDMNEIKEIKNMSPAKISDEEMKMAEQILVNMEMPFAEIDSLKDTFNIKVKELLQAKLEGKTFTPPVAEEPKPSQDLLEALKATVAQKKRSK